MRIEIEMGFNSKINSNGVLRVVTSKYHWLIMTFIKPT